MTNKRQLKKNIRYVCGDIAAELLVARAMYPEFDDVRVNKIINDIADLQETSVQRVTFSFDKMPRDFENMGAYNKARSEYNRKAYKKLAEDFRKGVEAIVKEMNEALPASAKEANKAKK